MMKEMEKIIRTDLFRDSFTHSNTYNPGANAKIAH